MGQYTLANDLNIPEERAAELVQKYISTPFCQWANGEVAIRLGQIYKHIVERDELTTNEKAYLVAVFAEQAAYRLLRADIETANHQQFRMKLNLPDTIRLNFNVHTGDGNVTKH